jgi:hypothetical protein
MKRKIFLFLAVFTLLTALSPQTAEAANKVAVTSAVLSSDLKTSHPVKKDNRAEILKIYLESYDSPLAEHAETFVEEADKHNLDWRLVAAIAGGESTFGHAIPPYSFNAWGYGVYGNNVRRFASWDDGIAVVSKAIRTDYLYDAEETNVYQIGSKYAADPNWPAKTLRFMAEIDAVATKVESKPTISLSL